MASSDLVKRWFILTHECMPAAAAERGWPVRFDHCFQRILLDHSVGGPWRETIAAPAYRHASDAQLQRAIALGEAALADEADLSALNRQSLAWRSKLRRA
ncbi:hypothetical protein [Erythrobacter litoralis]|uniref:GCN5-related N-acetyltransferase n=1 Tax=Erythrobacter litoralis (strain HTCC2594) TaxID=314225 RepID=Q2N9G2_ERYLH|nr:hypothetical protein [Erythrobacter litoralis]ABC63679.1 hypothetical protein ELI_07935 [Erythrobacter litoralis HTCC2594]